MKDEADFLHRIIRSIGEDEGECRIFLSIEMLQKAGLVVGDELSVIARDGELVIKRSGGSGVIGEGR